jgi:hypothetical protein
LIANFISHLCFANLAHTSLRNVTNQLFNVCLTHTPDAVWTGLVDAAVDSKRKHHQSERMMTEEEGLAEDGGTDIRPLLSQNRLEHMAKWWMKGMEAWYEYEEELRTSGKMALASNDNLTHFLRWAVMLVCCVHVITTCTPCYFI